MFELLLVAALTVQTPQKPAATWSLTDQYGRVHTPKELKGRVVLLVGGDKDAAGVSASWIRTTLTALGRGVDTSRVAVVRVADLRQVPVLARPFARAQLPTLDKTPVLLDFDGVIARRYGFESGNSNQIVLGTDGKVLLHTRGNAVSAVQATILAARIRDAIEKAPRP